MGVEVVAVGAEHAGEAVGRVGDLDLDAGQATGEEGAEEARPRRGGVGGRLTAQQRRPPGGELRLEPVLEIAVDEVMVVVAGEEDQPLAAELGGDQVEQAGGSIDCLANRAEEEVEEIAEEDQLVDAVEPGRQPLEEELLTQQVAPGPGPEVGVGDDQRPHPAAGY